MLLAVLASSALADPLVAIVIVDEEARDRGYGLVLEDVVVDDALPVDVAEGEHVQIVDPGGQRFELDVAPGEAWQVAGPKGEAWMSRIGADVRSDVIRVRGDGDVVRALAEELGAELHTVDGDFWLVRDEVLFDLPWSETEGLERLRGVRLVGASEPLPTDAPPPPRPASAARPLAHAPAVRPSAVAVAAPAVAAAPVAARRAEELPRAAPPAAPDPFADPPATVAPAEVPPAEVAPEVRATLDPADYVGLYLCGDDTVLNLAPGGRFAGRGVTGDWYVAAPGVVRMQRAGADVLRASIEVERHFCRAVW